MQLSHSSAPGPDGLPYDASRYPKRIGTETLAGLERHLRSGLRLGLDFSASLAVFLPRGDAAGDDRGIIRSATDERLQVWNKQRQQDSLFCVEQSTPMTDFASILCAATVFCGAPVARGRHRPRSRGSKLWASALYSPAAHLRLLRFCAALRSVGGIVLDLAGQ